MAQQVPRHLSKVARCVEKIVAVEYVREDWRSKVLDWCHQQAAGPIKVMTGNDVRAVPYPSEYVPLPAELDETEKHAVLGAVHDLVFQAQLGPPSGGKHPDALAVPYIALKLTMEGASEEDAARLLDILAELERTWRCAHSDDFACATWHGKEYRFTRNQAACIKVLWENWARGTPDVFGDALVKLAGVDPEGLRPLGEVFRVTGGKTHPAWKVMVVPGILKGSYQLAPSPRPAQDRSGVSSGGERSRKSRGKTRGSSRTKREKPSGIRMDEQ